MENVEYVKLDFDDWFNLRMQCDKIAQGTLYSNQFCFTNTPDHKPDPEQGCGSIKYNVDFEQGKTVRKDARNEEEFTVFNPEYYDTPAHQVYQELSKHYRLGRFRVMVSRPKACYSWHKDEHLRIHVPVVTNDRAYMLFEDMSIHHMPVGRAYVTDTTRHHTAFNAGLHTRIHLLGVILND